MATHQDNAFTAIKNETAKAYAINAAKILVVGGGVAVGLNKIGLETAGGIVGAITGVAGTAMALSAAEVYLFDETTVSAAAAEAMSAFM